MPTTLCLILPDPERDLNNSLKRNRATTTPPTRVLNLLPPDSQTQTTTDADGGRKGRTEGAKRNKESFTAAVAATAAFSNRPRGGRGERRAHDLMRGPIKKGCHKAAATPKATTRLRRLPQLSPQRERMSSSQNPRASAADGMKFARRRDDSHRFCPSLLSALYVYSTEGRKRQLATKETAMKKQCRI